MSPETKIQLRLLEAELTAATRPVLGRIPGAQLHGWGHEGFWFPERRYAVLGWPRVSHPEIVRRWLGDDAVVLSWCDCEEQCEDGWPEDCLGTLSDPEAAGHCLASVRQLLATGAMLPIDGSDTVVADYCGRVFARCCG